MKIINICFVLFGLVLVFSCKNESSEKISKDTADKNEILLDSNQALVYTVPTPVQVTSALKLLDIAYSDDIINDTKENNSVSISNSQKALNLGIYLVDLAYVVIYDKNQASLSYFSKIQKMTKELDLENQKTLAILNKCKSFINNKDSLYKILLTFQNEVDRKLFENQKEEVSILIVSGFYIEGLYMLTGYYEKLLQSRTLTHFYNKNLNNIILQQKIYLESLIELLKMYPNDDFKKLVIAFTSLNESFEKLNLKYNYSDKEKKLKDVTFDQIKIKEIRKTITALRTSIINNNYK